MGKWELAHIWKISRRRVQVAVDCIPTIYIFSQQAEDWFKLQSITNRY